MPKTLNDLIKRKQQLEARISALDAKEKTVTRKLRDRGLIVLGAFVKDTVPDLIQQAIHSNTIREDRTRKDEMDLSALKALQLPAP